MDIIDFLIRVAAGTGLAAVLGLEREATGKSAGLRTHAMVGLGAAVFTVLSMEAFEGADTSRVAAQIVSGIGFLGAGAIFRSGPLVKGLTTAAGLWAAAALGMAAGSGQIAWATVATGMAVIVLLVLRSIDTLIGRRRIGVVLEAVVNPSAAFIDVRDQLHSIEPQAELSDVVVDGDTTTLRFIVGSDRSEMLRNALTAMKQVVGVQIVE
jgi:putative Mg2+ transporter-C (MgtC) family protein